MRFIFMMILFTAITESSTLAYGATTGHIGIIKNMAGEVTIARTDSIIKGEPNIRLFEGDIVQTGANGKAGLILEDDTIISMGLNSRLTINKFMFQPNEKKLSLIAKIFHGTVSFLSGQITKLAPDKVHIETPYATVGLRGTHVLVQVD